MKSNIITISILLIISVLLPFKTSEKNHIIFKYSTKDSISILERYEKAEEYYKVFKINRLYDVIKNHETLQLKPYYLINGWYIGYGHLIRKEEKWMMNGITKRQADSLFNNDFMTNFRYFSDLNCSLEYKLLLTALSFNIGVGKIKSGRLYKELKKNPNISEEEFRSYYLKYSIIDGKEHKKLKMRRLEELNAILN